MLSRKLHHDSCWIFTISRRPTSSSLSLFMSWTISFSSHSVLESKLKRWWEFLPFELISSCCIIGKSQKERARVVVEFKSTALSYFACLPQLNRIIIVLCKELLSGLNVKDERLPQKASILRPQSSTVRIDSLMGSNLIIHFLAKGKGAYWVSGVVNLC